MHDHIEPPEDDPARPEETSFPWDEREPEPEDPNAPRQRHDAFTEARKCEFLRALVKTGCIRDACRRTGISARTLYRHQEDSPAFFADCTAALRMSGTPIELTAWQRAVEGVEEPFACGGEIHVRRRYDGGLLRLLLQGSNPKKYGPRPGFKRKRLLKHERKQMEQEIRAELRAQYAPEKATVEEACKALAKRLKQFGVYCPEAETAEAKLAQGWMKSPDGHWVPPGYAPAPGWIAPPSDDVGPGEAPSGPHTPRDSV